MATKGFIYVASNESMQGLLKIGRSKNHPDQRMQELAGTGVPTPFHLAYLALVEDHEAAELQLHQLFNESRVSQNREFFKLDVREALPKIREALNPLYEEVDDDLVTAPEPETVWPGARGGVGGVGGGAGGAGGAGGDMCTAQSVKPEPPPLYE